MTTEQSIQPCLVGLGPEEMTAWAIEQGLAKYRGEQLFRRIYAHRADTWEQVKELPKLQREELGLRYSLRSITLQKVQESEDGTKKFLFQLSDGRAIETVLIPSEMRDNDGSPRRRTICVSTQVGCPLNCKFCATASLKLKRNLTTGEIIEQFLMVQQHSDLPITNLVFMGMGEPMLNYDNVMKAVEIFTHPMVQLLAPRRITLSTAGMVEGIRRLADEGRQIKLALSLHATTDDLRLQLMPINKKYNLRELGDAMEYYYRKTKKDVTYEYILFDGLNDTDNDVKRLAKICRRVPSKVNVIPFHDIGFTAPEGLSAQLRRSSDDRFEEFLRKLRREGVNVMVRSSSGEDIDGACGQLAFSGEKQTVTSDKAIL